MEFNLKRDINKTIEMMERIENNENTDPLYSRPFSCATVNHKALYNKIPNSFEKFLGLIGSFSPELNAIYLGAKDVTCFDISFPACYAAYFQIAALLSLEYDEYVNFMCNHHGHQSFNFDTYQKIRDNLYVGGEIDTKKYFDVLYDYKGESDIRRYFFRGNYDFVTKKIEHAIYQDSNLYMDKEAFYKLKRKITKAALKILQADIREIPSLMKGEKFNMIYTSCAHDFMYSENNEETIRDYLLLMCEFKDLLADKGVLQAGYFYDIALQRHPIESMEQIHHFEQGGYEKISVDSKHREDIAYIYQKS